MLLLAGSAAWAHGLPPAGVLPFFDGEGRFGGGATSYGILLPDGERFLWTCEEVGPSAPRWLLRVGPERILAGGTERGLRETRDGGCSWITPSTGPLDGHYVSDLLRTPAGALFAVTASPDLPNGLFVSLDEGSTFMGPLVEAGAFLVETVALLNEDRVLVGGVDPEAGQARAEIWTVTSGTRAAVDLGVVHDRLRVLGTATFDDDAEGILAGEDNDGSVRLWRVAGDASSAPWTELPTRPVGLAQVGARALVLLDDEQLWELGEEGTTVITGGPRLCLLASPRGEAIGCDGFRDRDFLRSEDGQTWEPLVLWEEVVPRACPAGTPAAEACPVIWEQLQASTGLGRPPMGPEPDPSPDAADAPLCRCHVALASGPGYLAFLAGGWLAYRRRVGRVCVLSSTGDRRPVP